MVLNSYVSCCIRDKIGIADQYGVHLEQSLIAIHVSHINHKDWGILRFSWGESIASIHAS